MIIAIIPAKEESLRLPGKNMRLMLGKPLIDYTIEYAQKCSLLDEIYVSTDSKEIAEHSKDKGVKVIKRPESLCGDAHLLEVLRYCVKNIKNSSRITRVVCLQVDHPDRTWNLTSLIKKAIQEDASDLITISPEGKRNGSVRILKKEDLMADKVSYSIVAIKDRCTNIHTRVDFERARRHLLEKCRPI